MKKAFVAIIVLSICANVFFLYKRYFPSTEKVNIDQTAATRSRDAKSARVEIYKNSPIHPGDIVFVGSSLTEGFPLSVLRNDCTIKNRGLSGGTIDDVVEIVSSFIKSQPSKVYIEIGINDIKNSTEWNDSLMNVFISEYERLIVSLKNEDVTVYVSSVLPMNARFSSRYKMINEAVVRTNERISILCKNTEVNYIDLYPLFVESDKLADQYTYDGLHLNINGYLNWSSAIKNTIP